jgi:hypothetical protein
VGLAEKLEAKAVGTYQPSKLNIHHSFCIDIGLMDHMMKVFDGNRLYLIGGFIYK